MGAYCAQILRRTFDVSETATYSSANEAKFIKQKIDLKEIITVPSFRVEKFVLVY